MSTDWSRRDVLTTLSLTAAAGILSGYPRSASAQSVKWSAGTEAPKLKAPANATDCHHHVYNAKYPVDPKATLRPADATVEDYRALQKRIGTTRNVLVQPSTYGTDNRAHLEALAAFGPTARMSRSSTTRSPPRSSSDCTRSACAASASTWPRRARRRRR
jgi:Amidohydrolase